MEEVGSVSLAIKVLKKQLMADVKSSIKDAAKEAKSEAKSMGKAISDGMHGATGAVTGLTSAFKKLLGVLGLGISIASLIKFGKECVDLGSDLSEVQNVVDVTFGDMSDKVNEFAQSSIKSYGISETAAKNYMGTLGAMSQAFGFSQAEAYDQAEDLTALAGDMASFYNKTTDETFNALRSVYSGETEVLKQYGVVMTETALNEFALARGMGKTVSQMSEQEKVSLRLAFVQDKLAMASGDFARTQGSWANQTRVLSLQWESFKATIGQGLINVLTPVVQWLNSIMEAAQGAAQAFANFTATIMGVKPDMSGLSATTAAAAESAQEINEGVAAAGGSAKKAMKQLAGFDKLNILSKQKQSSGSGGGSSKPIVAPQQKQTIGDKVLEKYSDTLERLRKIAAPTTDALRRLWNEGLSRLKDFVWQGLQDFYNHFLVPLGTWVLGEGFPRFIDALNDGLMSINWSDINEALVDFWDALEPFSETIGEGLLWLWENVLVPLGSWTISEVVPRFFKTLSSILKIVNSILIALQPLWQWFWDKVLKPIAKWAADAFLSAWDNINKALSDFADWCSTHQSTIQNITRLVLGFAAAWGVIEMAAFITNCGGVAGALITLGYNFASLIGLTSVWSAVCGIASTVTTTLGAAFTFLTGPIGIVMIAIAALIAIVVLIVKNWEYIEEGAVVIWEAVCDVFQRAKEFIVGLFIRIGNWFSDRWNDIKTAFLNVGSWFSEKFSEAKNNVYAAFQTIGSWFSDRWNDVKDAFSNVGSWFSDKFSEAYENIKSVFGDIVEWASGIWDNIKSVFSSIGTNAGEAVGGAFRTVMNSILDMIDNNVNGFINLINGALSVINQIPGVSISAITPIPVPRLANGGFVEANTPQLAVIGDNRHQGEFVAPEDKLQAAVSSAMLAMMPQMAMMMANAVAKAGAGSGGDINLHNVIELDGEVVYDNQEKVKRRRERRRGGN